MILSFRNVFLKYRQSDGIWHTRLRQVIIATIVAASGGSIFALIIPIANSNILAWAGPLFTVFMAGYIWYNIFWKANRNPK